MDETQSIRAALAAIGIEPEHKWERIQRAGAFRAARDLFVQCAGVPFAEVPPLLAATTLHGKIPEALRLAHLIAGGVTRGVSRGHA